MEKKSLKINYLYNIAYQLLAILVPIITTPYVSRILGAKGIGTYSYTMSIVTYFLCFGALGINLYGQREIAYVQNDLKKRSKVFFELFILKFTTMAIASTIFYFLFASNGQYSLYYKILMFELIGNCFEISWFFQGMEEFKKITIRNFIIRIISVILIFVLIKSPDDLIKYFVIYSLCSLFGNLILFIDIKKYITLPKKIDIKHHILPILLLFIPQIATSIYTVLDKTMIGSLLKDMTEVGYYEQAQKIIKILLTVITALGTTMMPRIANCFAMKEKKKIKIYMEKTFRCIFLLALPMMFGVISVASNFVPIFLGSGFEKVIPIMSILSIVILFISLSSVTGTQYLLSTKRQKEFTISVVCGALVNFVLNLLLIKRFHALGAVIATIFAEFIVAIIQVFYIRKDFKFVELLKLSVNYFVSAVIMFISCVFVDKIIVNSFYSLILQVIVGMIVYFISLTIIVKDKFVLNICDELLLKIKRILGKSN